MVELQQREASWYEVDPAFYAHGGVCFNLSEADAISDVSGEAVLVAPAGSGEEALSLANMGGTVTVIGERGSAAHALIEASGVKVTWIEGDGLDASSVKSGAFDLVYSPWGTMDRLESLEDWANGVGTALKLGGRLVLYDYHPFSRVAAVHKGVFVIGNAYSGDWDADEVPWTVGGLVDALSEVGLATMMLEELDDSERFTTALDRFTAVRWEVRRRLPAAMVLAAVKVAE